MRPLIFLLTVLFATVSCSGQENRDTTPENKKQAHNDIPKPKESWKVDKEVDENGNVIRMDSVYSWSYHSDGRELSPETMDSLMQSFSQGFGGHLSMPGMGGEDFFGSFATDSTMFEPFGNDSLFFKGMEQRHKLFEEMMRKADSLHRDAMESFGKTNKL
ncbi:hypothetical protein SAMN02927921_00073 [Sinomicrobium oceani]|uniref:Uncharacterized protein n=1 Tax=Sinomicrobium oceani TaxID=1150368 RepID=A0A1K1LM81_9FLAO|nr:hypothetical protein [Sinomicrobium oceani]SFW11986.1 hypothetical protein SAMN02927921_00073 [Sinomicrobium oceani]